MQTKTDKARYNRGQWASVVIIATIALLPVNAHAAIYLGIDTIPGTVNKTPYEDWIDVGTVEFGTDRDISSGEKGGTQDINIGVGELSTISWSQVFDKSFPLLWISSINGNSVGKAEFHFVADSGEEETKKLSSYFRIKLDRVFIKSLGFYGDANNDHGVGGEMLFSKITIELDLFDGHGGVTDTIIRSWDVTSNQPLPALAGMIAAANLGPATLVPLPAALWMLLSGIGIIAMRRRGG